MQGHDALLMPACDQAAQPLDAADLRHAGLGKLRGELSGRGGDFAAGGV